MTVPVNATRSPPRTGPRVKPTFHVIMPSALAAGSSSAGTMRGMIDWRAGLPTAKKADCTATTRYSTETSFHCSSDCARKAIEQTHSPAAETTPTFRRSKASDRVPPYRPKPTSGTSWNSPTSPTMRLDPVMSQTWRPTATEVICWPTFAMPSADHRRRYGALTRSGVRSAKRRVTSPEPTRSVPDAATVLGTSVHARTCHAGTSQPPHRTGGHDASDAPHPDRDGDRDHGRSRSRPRRRQRTGHRSRRDAELVGAPHGLDWRKANAGGDPDRDGVSNIKEFRLSQNPRRADAARRAAPSRSHWAPRIRPSAGRRR